MHENFEKNQSHKGKSSKKPKKIDEKNGIRSLRLVRDKRDFVSLGMHFQNRFWQIDLKPHLNKNYIELKYNQYKYL